MPRRRRNKVPGDKAVLYIRDLPRDLKDQFKAWCYKRGTTMSKSITVFMRETIRSDRRLEREVLGVE